MALKITTGTDGPALVHVDDKAAISKEKHIFDDTTPSERVIYPTDVQQHIVVTPKTMAIVTAYDINDGTKIKFRKVLKSNGIPEHGGSSCCGHTVSANAIRLNYALLDCWEITKKCPVFIIKTPGIYEIEVIGETDYLQVTVEQFDLQDVNNIGTCGCD